jgi:hypothetical protein
MQNSRIKRNLFWWLPRQDRELLWDAVCVQLQQLPDDGAHQNLGNRYLEIQRGLKATL